MKRILLLIAVSVCGAWLAQLYPLRRPLPTPAEQHESLETTPQLVRRRAPIAPEAGSEQPCVWIEIFDVASGQQLATSDVNRVTARLITTSATGEAATNELEVVPAAAEQPFRCALPANVAERFQLSLEVEAPGYLQCRLESEAAVGETLTIQLAAAAELTGQVVDAASSPVPAAALELRLPLRAQAIWRACDDRIDELAPEALSLSIEAASSAGWFEFGGVPAASEYVLAVNAAGYAPRTLRFALASGTNELPPIVLERGAGVQVRIQSAAAPGVPFEIELKTKSGAWTSFATALARPGEVVEFSGLPAREVRVVAERFLPHERCWEIAAGNNAELLAGERSVWMELEVAPASIIEVEVHLPDGSPAAGARVSLRHERAREFRTQEHEVDDDGRLRFSGVPEGPVRIIVSAPTTAAIDAGELDPRYLAGQKMHDQFAGSEPSTVVLTLAAAPPPGPPEERIEFNAQLPTTLVTWSGDVSWFLVNEKSGYLLTEVTAAESSQQLSIARGDLRERHRVEHVRNGDWYASRWVEVGERGRLDLPLVRLGAAGVIEGVVSVGGAPPIGGRVHLYQAEQLWVHTKAIASAEVDFQSGRFALSDIPGSPGSRVVVLHLDGGRARELATLEGGQLYVNLGGFELAE